MTKVYNKEFFNTLMLKMSSQNSFPLNEFSRSVLVKHSLTSNGYSRINKNCPVLKHDYEIECLTALLLLTLNRR